MGSSNLPLIHIGFYKTASSWLQKFLFEPQYGYQHVIDAFSLHPLLITPEQETFDPSLVRRELDDKLAAIVADGRIPVISSEALSGDLLRGGHNRWQNADRLRQVFDQARILLVVREQRQLLRSMYKTMVFFGFPYSLNRLLREGPDGFDVEFICFHSLAEYYTGLFGPDAVLVLPYEFFKHQPHDFIKRVFAHRGPERIPDSSLQRLPLNRVVNPGESLSYIQLQRWINRLTLTRHRNYAGLLGNNGFEHVLRRIAWHKRHARETSLDARLERRFATRVDEHLQGRFAYSNRRLQTFCPVEFASFAYEM